MPTHYTGPVHPNSLSNPVTQFVPVRQQRAIYGVTENLSVLLRFGRDIVLFTDIQDEVISSLTTTVLSLSPRSLVCYQTNSTDNFGWRAPSGAAPSGSRKHFSDIRRQEYYNLFRQSSRELRVAATQHATFGQCKRLPNVLSANFFVVQTKILYCGHTITH